MGGRAVGVLVQVGDSSSVDAKWVLLPRDGTGPTYSLHEGDPEMVPRVSWGLNEHRRVGEMMYRVIRASVDSAADAESVTLALESGNPAGVVFSTSDELLEVGDGPLAVRSWRASDWRDGNSIMLYLPRCLAFKVVVAVEYGGTVADHWLALLPNDIGQLQSDHFRVMVVDNVEIGATLTDTAIIAVDVPVDSGSGGRPLGTIGFGFDSVVVSDDAMPTLNTAVKLLETDTALRVRIEGHTDTIGTKTYNQELAMKRARSVLREFEHASMKPTRFDTLSFGELRPKRTGGTPPAWGEDRDNRRVELVLVGSVHTEKEWAVDTLIAQCTASRRGS